MDIMSKPLAGALLLLALAAPAVAGEVVTSMPAIHVDSHVELFNSDGPLRELSADEDTNSVRSLSNGITLEQEPVKGDGMRVTTASFEKCNIGAGNPGPGTSTTAPSGDVISKHRFGSATVGFVAVKRVVDIGNGDTGEEIEVIRIRDDSGCTIEQVDTYYHEGGAPTLEAVFTHTVQGDPNLFTIVSWPLVHVGLGMNGRYYSVHAYRDAGGALVRNDAVMKNQQLHGGVEGLLEGESSTFEGKTEQDVVAMLERLGLD